MGLLDDTTQTQYYAGNDYGNYQFTSLDNIITQFQIAYVGEDKIISKIKRTDIAFYAQRALQELSFDTFKSIKSQEIEVPASLQMILPQDYVNYTKISWADSAGIKHLLYPTSKTSNPPNPLQNSDGDFELTAVGELDSSTNTIVLDAEYKDIKVGMIVSGPRHYIPLNTIVASTLNSNSITTITLSDISGAVVVPNYDNSGTTLSFKKRDGSLILEKQSSHVVENLSWNMTDYKITGTASELTDIKVGMLVSHDNFPIGTVVTNVYTTTIVVDQLPDAIVASGGEVTFISPDSESDTWSNYKSGTPSENQDDYQDGTYWPIDGERYGLDPQHAQANGSFYIDDNTGKIHFSSNISGKTVILDYISDGLGTDAEMQVHKFAEEALYKHIAYAVLSTRANTPEYIVARFKKERFAETRKAKLRLSNIKLEELTQILRGKSKHIKH
tara:strand:+ start:937 stop:2268 length:1332 start_codon:yes stop_codon:yes gene_type:complete